MRDLSMNQTRPRAFTILEVVVALALGVIVVGTAAAVLATTLRDNRRQRVSAGLQRDAEFVSQLLTQEIRLAGLGVPSGRHVNAAFGGTVPGAFDARRVLEASADAMLILGDQPRPDANYPAFGILHSAPNAALNRISWHTENNGTCIPGACTIGDASIFFPGGENCTAATSRTCPWYGRLKSGDRIQIASGTGLWSHSAMSSLAPATSGGLVSAQLSVGMDGSGTWTNTGTGSGPTGLWGQGFVASLDRVGYWYDSANRTILRRQCWGDPDPDNANWPPPATASILPASFSVDPTGASASTCTADEIIARNVDAVTFRYLNQAGADQVGAATAAAKNSIVRIEWTIVFEQVDTTLGRPVTYTAVGSVRLQNFQANEP